MKPGRLILLVITATAFISTFLISQGLPTGFLIGDWSGSSISITGADASETAARISWKTQKESMSVFAMNNASASFEKAREFSKEITGLSPGTSYKYVIRACDESKCHEKTSEVTTKIGKAAEPEAVTSVTGAVVGVDIARTVQKSISLAFFALIGMAALVIAGRIGYEKIESSRDPMQGMVDKAKKLIENEQYEQAYEIYAGARKTYSQLEEAAKLKHYDSLISIYQSLKRYSALKEAQRLAEKYAQGTITNEELRQLNEMLAN